MVTLPWDAVQLEVGPDKLAIGMHKGCNLTHVRCQLGPYHCDAMQVQMELSWDAIGV